MATISKGYSFGATEQVTAAKLHSLVDSASITGIATAEIANNAVTNDKIYSVDGSKLTGLASVPSGAGVIPSANIASSLATIATIYPVGSLYISTLSTNPGTLLGVGTWTAFGAGRVLVGRNGSDTDFDVAEETGGDKTVSIAETNLPAHSHPAGTLTGGAHTHTVTGRDSGSEKTAFYMASSGSTYSITSGSGGAVAVTGATGNTGSGTALSVMNPYIVVYMWKRTA